MGTRSFQRITGCIPEACIVTRKEEKRLFSLACAGEECYHFARWLSFGRPEKRRMHSVSFSRRRGGEFQVSCRTARTAVLISLVLTLQFPILAGGQTVSGASGPTWVRPVKENVVVYTSTGSKVERIGILTENVVVQVVGEDRSWYKIRFTRENAEFEGWVLKQEVAVEGTPANPPKREKPEPSPTPKPKEEEKQPEEKTLSLKETHDKLTELVQIPVGSGPQVKLSYDLDAMRKSRGVSGSTGMTLFGGQKAKMEVLALFDVDEVIEYFVEEKIRSLKELEKEAHPDFDRVIDCYIRALEAYIEKKTPDFVRLVNQAERFWNRILGLEDEVPG
jgi:hypothetical protein